MSESDQSESFNQLQAEEKALRKNNTLREKAKTLQGAKVSREYYDN